MLDPIAIVLNVLLFAGIALTVYALFRFPVPTEVPMHRRIALAMGAGRRQTIFESSLLAPISTQAPIASTIASKPGSSCELPASVSCATTTAATPLT